MRFLNELLNTHAFLKGMCFYRIHASETIQLLIFLAQYPLKCPHLVTNLGKK